jgi:hypothetical protein
MSESFKKISILRVFALRSITHVNPLTRYLSKPWRESFHRGHHDPAGDLQSFLLTLSKLGMLYRKSVTASPERIPPGKVGIISSFFLMLIKKGEISIPV